MIGEIEYDGKTYRVECITGNLYRAYNGLCGVVFEAEIRGKGTYFKYRSSSDGKRGYSAWRYSYKWIPIMREATYLIATKDGLYSYETDKFYKLTDGKLIAV